jgi:hypothetical protein
MNEAVRRELADLRALVEDARSMPMSGSVVVNRPDLLAAVERLEAAAEQASAESADVLARRDEVLAEGEEIAIEVVRQAELRRDELVSDSEVFRVAQRRSDEMLAGARAEADALRADAERYIEQRFAQFEHSLERTLGEVRRGIAHLSTRGPEDEPDPTTAPGPVGVLPTARDAG